MQKSIKTTQLKKQLKRLILFISFHFNNFAKLLNRSYTAFSKKLARIFVLLRRKFLAETIMLSTTVLILAAMILNTKIAVVSSGGEVDIYRTLQFSPTAIAQESKFHLSGEDLVEQVSNSSKIANLEIKHNFPVQIYVDGKKYSTESTGGTVNSVLSAAGIRISDGDLISHTLSEPVTPNMDIAVARVSYQTVEIEKNIPKDIIKIKSNTIPSGTILEKKQGEDGLVVTVLQKKYLSGYLVNEQYIEATIVKEPVASILNVGTGVKKPDRPTDSYTPQHIDVETLSYSKVLDMKATAYTYGDGGIWGDYTATGKPVQVGYVAVDPKVIPLGSKLYIAYPSGAVCYGFAVAQDTGGAIKGNKVDLFFNTRQECRIFGRRNVKVYVLD